MTDDHPSTGSPKKTWLDKLSQLFQGEPKDRNDLVEVIADAEERDLIDQDTKDRSRECSKLPSCACVTS